MKKIVIIKFFLFSFIAPILLFVLMWVVDPLKLFHQPYFNKERLYSNMREQTTGILKYWNYNSLIVGSSMLENTSSKQASELLGGEFINISLAGSDFFERSMDKRLILSRVI